MPDERTYFLFDYNQICDNTFLSFIYRKMAIRVSLLKDCKMLRNGYACNLRFQKVINRSLLSTPVRSISNRNIVNMASKNKNNKLRPLLNQCCNIQR